MVREAARNNVCGIHLRYSHGVVQGVHTLRFGGHWDAHGFPDWIFWGEYGAIVRELKGMETRVTKDQKRCVLELAAAGLGCGGVAAVRRGPGARDIQEDWAG